MGICLVNLFSRSLCANAPIARETSERDCQLPLHMLIEQLVYFMDSLSDLTLTLNKIIETMLMQDIELMLSLLLTLIKAKYNKSLT